MSWAILCLGRTKRFRASTMLRAVKMVAARMVSLGWALCLRREGQEFCDVVAAVVFAAGAFWWGVASGRDPSSIR